MITVEVKASRPYQVCIGENLLANAGLQIRQTVGGTKAVIVTDDTVNALYGETVSESLVTAGYEISVFEFPHGEASKCADTYIRILNFLAEQGLTRTDIIVALGGGVVGDMAGFAAATYLRGIRYVQIPTTLLAMVDSSVGGKTAIDLEAGKNLAGAFWQPALVICDHTVLSTLPALYFADGAAEVIKYGVLRDPALLDLMKNAKDNIVEIIKRSVSIKRDIVFEDEFDLGVRQLLNFGHTIGHAIEKASNYQITHGHAVAIGMALLTKAAEKQGDCKENTYHSLTQRLAENDLDIQCKYPLDDLLDTVLSDKKRSSDQITLVIPKYIGKCDLLKLPIINLKDYLKPGFEE